MHNNLDLFNISAFILFFFPLEPLEKKKRYVSHIQKITDLFSSRKDHKMTILRFILL